jgi:hypothetical protein
MNRVTADMLTLMRQAPMTVEVYLIDAIKTIDNQFGEGYAKQNPQLVGAFIQACAHDFHATIMLLASGDVVTALDGLNLHCSNCCGG